MLSREQRLTDSRPATTNAAPAGGRRISWRAWSYWRVWLPLSAALYRTARRHLARWPLAWRARLQPAAAGPARIAYYYSFFPVLSETFIQREVSALRAAGLHVDVLAHEAKDAALFDAEARQLMQTTTYLPAVDSWQRPPGFWRLAARHPCKMVNCFLFAVGRQHAPHKTFARDRQLFYRAAYLAGVLTERRITHVHSPWAFPDATAALLAARLAGVRYTVQARAVDVHRDTAVFGRHERLAGAAFVITNTYYNETMLRAWLPGPDAPPVHIIYNGIDVQRFEPPARRSPRGALRILCVARLGEQKGLEYLLRACKQLRDGGTPVSCEIIGGRSAHEVNYYLMLKKLYRAYGLESVVHLAGAQPFDRVLERYAEADVFVLPAVVAADGRHDVTPNALIEAMAMQLPVISTTVGGIPEIVEDGVSGILVPPRDADALAGAIRRVLGDPALRLRLGVNARRRVEERFDIRKNIRAYVELFDGRSSSASSAVKSSIPTASAPAATASEPTTRGTRPQRCGAGSPS